MEHVGVQGDVGILRAKENLFSSKTISLEINFFLEG